MTLNRKSLTCDRQSVELSFFLGICLQVNMIRDDGTVIHFNNPKVQASLSAHTFSITGHAETKQLTEMLPGILCQLGADGLANLRKMAEQFPRQCECTHTHAHTLGISVSTTPDVDQMSGNHSNSGLNGHSVQTSSGQILG